MGHPTQIASGERRELFVPDAGHALEILHRAEGAVRLTVGHDLPAVRRPRRERIELGHEAVLMSTLLARRRSSRPGARRHAAHPRRRLPPRRRCPPRDGTTICSPSRHGARQIERARPLRRTSGRVHRVLHPRALRQLSHPRFDHGASHVHEAAREAAPSSSVPSSRRAVVAREREAVRRAGLDLSAPPAAMSTMAASAVTPTSTGRRTSSSFASAGSARSANPMPPPRPSPIPLLP